MIVRSFFIAICLIGLSTACRNVELTNTEPFLFEEYYIRFLQAERELKAQATYYEGDSLETATPKTFFGGVSFLGSGMKARSLPNNITRYSTTRDRITYPERFRFGYKNDSGELIDYNLEMAPIGSYSIPDTINKRSPITISIENSPLEADESIVILINDSANKASTFSYKGPMDNTSFILSQQQLAALAIGKAEVYLVKKQVTAKKNNHRKIQSTIEFYSASQIIEVIE